MFLRHKFTLLFIANMFISNGLQIKMTLAAYGYSYYLDAGSPTVTRAKAQEYCERLGLELAKLASNKDFLLMRFAITSPGRYWLDGIDRMSSARFELNGFCSTNRALDYSEIANTSLSFAPQCLTFVRAAVSDNNKIEAVLCTTTAKVLCGAPSTGCDTTSTTPREMVPNENPKSK